VGRCGRENHGKIKGRASANCLILPLVRPVARPLPIERGQNDGRVSNTLIGDQMAGSGRLKKPNDLATVGSGSNTTFGGQDA
jgi:hypothetical protein